MPTELRHLLFRPAEVVQAIREYQRHLGLALPAGTMLTCRPDCDGEGGEVRFRLTIVPDPVRGRKRPAEDEAVREDVVIEGPALAAALILYCRDRRIPLPAGADKSLQLYGGQICLVSTLNPWGGDLPQAALFQQARPAAVPALSGVRRRRR